MNHRLDRINTLIRKYFDETLIREISLKPGVFVTVAKVDTTPDLRYTRISLSVFPEKDRQYVLKTMEKAGGHIRHLLSQKLATKIFPTLQFSIDETESRAEEVEKLLKDLKN